MKSLGLHGKVIVLCRSRTEQNMWGCLHVSAPDMVRAIQQFNRRRKVGEGKGFCDSNVPWPSPIKIGKCTTFLESLSIYIYIYIQILFISQSGKHQSMINKWIWTGWYTLDPYLIIFYLYIQSMIKYGLENTTEKPEVGHVIGMPNHHWRDATAFAAVSGTKYLRIAK